MSRFDGHTKGPWKVFYDEDEGTFELGASSYLENDGFYDTVHHVQLYDCSWPEDRDQFQEKKANAELFAAASDLLAVLGEAREALKATQPHIDSKGVRSLVYYTLEHISSLLDRKENET